MIHPALIIFICSYGVIAIQNIPGIHISRPAGSLLGATAMVLAGVLTLHEAYGAIDWDTILFVLGMMIIVAYVELSGFFDLAERLILQRARTPFSLLFWTVLSSGFFSSIFMNDTICLLFTPIVLRMTRRTGLNPVPYLIAVAASANIGSVMTIIGNPQNMLIAIHGRVPFLRFLAVLAPVTACGLAAAFCLIRLVYRHDIHCKPLRIPPEPPPAYNRGLLALCSVTVTLLLALLCLGLSPPGVAMGLACFLILVGATRPRKALEEVDWPLLLLFAALFIIMKGVERSGMLAGLASSTQHWLLCSTGAEILNLSLAAAFVSNVVSNVPAVMLFIHMLESLQPSEAAWLTLAMASTLAGNLTIIGSIANIIVFETARGEVRVGFFEYLKVGLPLTALTLAIGVICLMWLL